VLTRASQGLVGATLLIGMIVADVPAASASATCSTTDAPGGYTVQLCLTAPGEGATVSGAATVAAAVEVGGTAPAVNGITYTLDGAYLLFDEQTPYSFVLHTDRYPTARHSMSASVVFSGGYSTPPLNLSFRIAAAEDPPPPPAFTPTAGTDPAEGKPFLVAAVGDGASGLTAEEQTADLVASWHPILFLYLGDVYAHGAAEEYRNWYGENGKFYSRFRSITNPTLGNHEFETDPTGKPYYDYWGDPPPYYSYDTHGWHVVTLDDVTPATSFATTSAQYRWLSVDLAAHPNPCTLVTFHRPLFNLDPEDKPATDFAAFWQLIASHHVPLVLNGHAHHYERWQPLDGSGNFAADGTTEFVIGTGGQWISRMTGHDARMVAGFDTTTTAWGATLFELSPSGAVYQFVNNAGATEDYGSLPCAGVRDVTAPTAPTGVTGHAVAAHEVDLSWNRSSDDVGVTGYRVLRDGIVIGEVGGYQTSFADPSNDVCVSNTYAVIATDDAHNASPPSTQAIVDADSPGLACGGSPAVSPSPNPGAVTPGPEQPRG